jgi:4-amino-4-deoxy-L-arabinose transferase-like glycosyltransferase
VSDSNSGHAGAHARGPAGLLLALVPPLLALLLAARTVGRESCTVDEFGNLPLTVVYWHADALHVDRGNPPLTRWLQGIPLLPVDPDPGVGPAELAGIDTSWDLGYRFEDAHRDDYQALLVRARAASVALLLFAVLGVYAWARDLAGPLPALASALLAAASPNLIAHGRLVTPDIGLAAFVVWAGWAGHRAARTGGWGWTAAAGLLTGAACLSKLSGLLLAPALLLLLATGVGTTGQRTGRAAAFGAVALLVLYAGYAFPVPGAFHGIPTPLPSPYVAAIDMQLKEPAYPAYLLGHVREHGGWRLYYVVAFLVKTPLPALALFVLAAVAVARGGARRFRFPLLLACAFFVALGFVTKKNVGIRYLLPMYPLLHVAAASVFGRGARLARGAAVLVLAAVAAGVAASAAPIASFNGVEKLLGGKRAVLADSNLDWGQALPDLRDWMVREHVDTVQLAYFGRVDPSLYGIDWFTLKTEPVRGAVAISATLAVGRPYVVLVKRRPSLESTLAWSGTDSWAWLRDRTPDAELGGGAMLVWKDAAAPGPEGP